MGRHVTAKGTQVRVASDEHGAQVRGWLARYGDSLCVATGMGMLADGMFLQTGQQTVASTLVVVGAGVVVIGVFSTRLVGKFQLGPGGFSGELKGGLTALRTQEELTTRVSDALAKLAQSSTDVEIANQGDKP